MIDIRKIHFVGIGGIGMSGLAEIMHGQGYTVTGSDRAPSGIIERLRSLGIACHVGHDAKHVDCDLVVYTAAANLENPELIEANRRRIPVIKRAALLGEFVRTKKGVAVSGTHGKTTTTAMIGMMLEHAELHPTIFAGGIMKELKTNAKLGDGEYVVVEADEYDRSFLELHPWISVINNIESDHLDCYHDLDDIKQTFVQFANQTSIFGSVWVNIDDANASEIIPNMSRRVKTFGLSTKADVSAANIMQISNKQTFDVLNNHKLLGTATLNLSGSHNVKNALACFAIGHDLNIPFSTIAKSLELFEGTARRFEILGTINGVTWIDDYAHHPTEIQATLRGARQGWPKKRIIAVFQPHLYTRTRDYLNDFARSFTDADDVVLTDIYAAREEPIEGISGQRLFEETKKQHKRVWYVEDMSKLAKKILSISQEGDLVITMGAGDITDVGRSAVSKQTA
ncbi:UDP-N-acetylmuramate--L-alanine ligase [bacterium]|nr:UDP-N-acetylmuramate--L-alanine ligase [bacterium]